MYDLAGLMNKYDKLHVTTKGDYIFEFDRVCRFRGLEEEKLQTPLVPLDAVECTSERHFISKSRFFLQSGAMQPDDPRDYKGRYQNFNTIFREIGRL
jgi:hypothetical protein